MRKKKHILRRLLLLILFAAAAGVAYMYLAPLMRPQEIMAYEAYTVSRGSIATEKSFSAGISVASSETHQNTTRATSIREIYVTNGQKVRKGDKLMLLDNGELLEAGLDGVVTELRFDTTDWLWNNVNLIQISDLTNLKVSLSVDEYDIRNVLAGQKCFVTIVPTGSVFETEISHVDRVSASSGQVAYYTASAELIVPESVLPGMTASVTIPSDRAENVLVLDMAALAFDEEKRPYVLRKTDAGYEKVPVTTGLSDGMQVEIVSGLREGDTVWAVSEVETVQNTYTISDLYKLLAGEKIVINDMTGGNQGGRNGFSGPQIPGGNWGMPQNMNPSAMPGMVERGDVPLTGIPASMEKPEETSPPAVAEENPAEASNDNVPVMESPRRREQEREETP